MASPARAERRRQERASARPHAWRFVVVYRLDDWQAQQLANPASDDPGVVIEIPMGEFPAAGDDRVWLRADMVVRDEIAPEPICWACEQGWRAVHDKPCAGQPPGRLEYVP